MRHARMPSARKGVCALPAGLDHVNEVLDEYTKTDIVCPEATLSKSDPLRHAHDLFSWNCVYQGTSLDVPERGANDSASATGVLEPT